jgi:hypothetical protein
MEESVSSPPKKKEEKEQYNNIELQGKKVEDLGGIE